MLEALAWGTLAASSLLIGAWLGVLRDWSPRVVGLVLGFGAGALISAVSFELWQEALTESRLAMAAAGLGAGALVYYAADRALDARMRDDRARQHPRGAGEQDSGSALALGALLDGIPEQLVLGIGVAAGDGAGAALLAAIFVSNLPEAIGSASAMRAAGRPRGLVLRLWLSVMLVTTLAAVAGFAAADALSSDGVALIQGFAAGALLVMLVDAMIPSATHQAGRTTGLMTALGFAVAAALSAV
jgi:ZIP family zinc transporter